MNREQAKQLLQAYGPGDNASDPQMRAALELAAGDSELMQWLKEQQAIDRSIQQKLRSAPPPEGLVGEIVAGWKEQTGRDRLRFIRPKYVAWAAAFVLLAAIAAALWNRLAPGDRDEMAAFPTEMAAFLKEFPRLDVYIERQSEVRQWLMQRPALGKAEIPARLQKFPAIGCRDLAWRGKRIVLVCLMVDGEVVHLFLIPGVQGPTPINPQPQFAHAGRFTTATWPQGDLTYVVMTPGSKEFLQKLL